MSLHYRLMRRADVPWVTQVIAGNPLMAEHYGESLALLGSGLIQLLETMSAQLFVFEELTGAATHRYGFAGTVFISDNFASRLLTPPFVWIGPEVVRLICAGESPLLSDDELRQNNLNGGLNLAFLTSWFEPKYRVRLDVVNAGMDCFRQYHQGYRIKRIIPQTELEDVVVSLMEAGAFAVNNDGSHSALLDQPPEEFVRQPHCLLITGGLARPGTWLGSFLVYQEPRAYFSPSEQRLLGAALTGLSDEELAVELASSLSGVKKTWRRIYERLTREMPELLPETVAAESLNGERGRGKRQKLLAYLRRHPEELRPLPRKSRSNAA